MGGIVVID